MYSIAERTALEEEEVIRPGDPQSCVQAFLEALSELTRRTVKTRPPPEHPSITTAPEEAR